MPLFIRDADITTMDVDVIVNAANPRLACGGGVCGAIFAVSDGERLAEACQSLAPVSAGQAVATPSFGLRAPWIIHAVGPIWQGGHCREAQILASCYRAALALAADLGARSIAFPLISSGIYGFPAQEALQIARATILEELEASGDQLDVYLCLWGSRDQARRGLEPELVHYLQCRRTASEALPQAMPEASSARRPQAAPRAASAPQPQIPSTPGDTGALFCTPAPGAAGAPHPQGTPRAASPAADAASLEEALQHLDWGFSRQLLALIDARGLSDAQVYRRAGLTRQHFSKIRSNPSYQPRKQTVLALAFTLELTLPETRDLLSRAGFALNPSSIDDAICAWYLEHEMFDIDRVNQALYAYDRRLLGA